MRASELNVIPVSTSIQDFKTHGNTLHQYLCKETIGDEYHFLLVCKNENIITLRNKYLPNYYRVYPNHAKFEGLLSICNVELYKRLSIFIRKAAALLWLYVTACIML